MKKLLFLLVLPILIFQSCDEDPSTENKIKEFTISSSSYQNLDIKNISIDEKEKKVFVAFSNTELDEIFPLTITPTIKISTGAKISPKSDISVIFNNPDEYISYEVTSEEGKKETWILQLVHKQIQNADFQKWYSVQLSTTAGYEELGQSASSTFWASANTGTSTYSVYNTQTYIVGEDTMALIKTDIAGPVVLAAGTLFTGKFNIAGAITHPTDPQKATDFGIPFYWKPSSIKFKFKYTAGADYIRATLINPSNLFGGFTIEHLTGSDNCKIYAFLEKRTGDIITEIARATFVSGTTGAEFIEQTVDFVYANNEEPTHLTVVFTSSKDGDYWTGAVGSTLIVNDLELIYP